MEFMRAISIVFVVIHVYWFCYRAFVDAGINIGVVDKILLNFQRTAGLFSNLLVTKVFAVIFLALSCLGTKGVKNQKMTWRKIYTAFLSGLVLFFMNWWMLDLPFNPTVNAAIYTVTLTAGYILLLMSGVWISRMLKHNLMEDVFNTALWRTCSTPPTRVSCRKPALWKTSIPSTCRPSSCIRARNGTDGSTL